MPSLWLLSDLAAIDANGMPTLTPTAGDLGLPWGAAVPETQCFLKCSQNNGETPNQAW